MRSQTRYCFEQLVLTQLGLTAWGLNYYDPHENLKRILPWNGSIPFVRDLVQKICELVLQSLQSIPKVLVGSSSLRSAL